MVFLQLIIVCNIVVKIMLKKILQKYYRENRAFKLLTVPEDSSDGTVDTLNKGTDVYTLMNYNQTSFKTGDNLIAMKVDDNEVILGYSPFITGYTITDV